MKPQNDVSPIENNRDENLLFEKKQIEILELKNYNWNEKFPNLNSRLDMAEKESANLKIGQLRVSSLRSRKEKEMKENEQS